MAVWKNRLLMPLDYTRGPQVTARNNTAAKWWVVTRPTDKNTEAIYREWRRIGSPFDDEADALMHCAEKSAEAIMGGRLWEFATRKMI